MIDPHLLPALAWFVRVAQHRSFTRAALEMDVSRAALSQQVKALEQQLKVRLLNRTTRDMSLTEEGQRLYDVLAPAFSHIGQAVASAGDQGKEPGGLIRLTTSRPAARLLIEPHLGEFLRRYPKLRLELDLDDGMSNIFAEGMDAGIRLGESLDPNVVAVPVTPPLEMAIVGAPDYLQRAGIPQTPQDLSGHNCIAYRFTTSGTLDRWSFTQPDESARTVQLEPQGNAVFNDDDSMLRAALQGTGLVQHLDLCVLPYLQSGQLQRVLSNWCKPFPGFFLYLPSRAQMPAKIRALMDFLIEKRRLLEQAQSALRNDALKTD
ncbi:LysR family transcriptional regulator [Undibacterium squillarum]|uniref:LysR family transcriptional regulator n=1 Tax=Undibacterium squillarum TaxID=1131567 RepID=UPI0035B24C51